MGYKVKWVEENLGVTRKALRVFEEKGLMPKNENNHYRDYSDKDIERIWYIRVLQGMGYSLKEIADIANNSGSNEWDFSESITMKIKELECKKAETERLLGYAKAIKLTGRFPSRPEGKIGSVRFDDFKEEAVDEYNVNNNPQFKHMQELVDIFVDKTEDEWQDSDLGQVLLFLESLKSAEENADVLLAEVILPKTIINHRNLGVSHPEIQLMVKMMYENQIKTNPETEALTPRQFARYGVSVYLDGDIGKLQEKKYGKEECKFIADAIAVFGGYINSDDPEML